MKKGAACTTPGPIADSKHDDLIMQSTVFVLPFLSVTRNLLPLHLFALYHYRTRPLSSQSDLYAYSC